MKKFITLLLALLCVFGIVGCSKKEKYEDGTSKGTYHDSDMEETVRPFYGLYNVNSEQGFSGYDIIDDLQQSLVDREEEAAALEEAIINDPNLTQTELNDNSYRMYQIWDVTLNEIWEILKQNLNADDMAALTEEQLNWIAMKEASMKEAGEEVEGGSMYGMVVNQTGAKLTKERVYELLEIVKKCK